MAISINPAPAGRNGEVIRTLPHGTVIIWDMARSAAYPFYGAGPDCYQVGETVFFSTDETDTVILTVERQDRSGQDNVGDNSDMAVCAKGFDHDRV